MPLYPISSYVTLAYLAVICFALEFIPSIKIAFYVAPICVVFLVGLYKSVIKREEQEENFEEIFK